MLWIKENETPCFAEVPAIKSPSANTALIILDGNKCRKNDKGG